MRSASDATQAPMAPRAEAWLIRAAAPLDPAQQQPAAEAGHETRDDADAGARGDADADRTEKLLGVEAHHRAEQRRAHGQRRGELPAGATDDARHRVERALERRVRGGEGRIGPEQQRQRRNGQGRQHPQRLYRDCVALVLPREAPHQATLRPAAPSSDVEVMRLADAQSSRSAGA